jgi:hypothetical protein
LEEILHEELLFGHSDGRLDSKSQFIDGVVAGEPTYEKIDIFQQTLVSNEDMALLRGEMAITLLRKGLRNTYRLNVMHVWVLEKKSWRLIGRQATRLPS